MSMTCTICSHPNRAEIDEALVSGQPKRSIAKRFGCSDSAVFRHARDHISATLARSQAAETVRADTLFDRLKQISSETREILDECMKTGNLALALQAIARYERQIELEAKMLGQIDESVKIAFGVSFEGTRMSVRDIPDRVLEGWITELKDLAVSPAAGEVIEADRKV